ncbi:unnamed protein product [Sphagnum tenellum]
MWEHRGCLESVQQDAISRCGHLECHTWRMCHAWACHAGLVDEGMHCYASIITLYMISAWLDHYTCMADLLGHADHLQEAENMIKQCPVNEMWLHGWLCSVLAKSMILWKWENLLLKEFLNWSLKILLVNIANKHLCWWWQQPSP